MIQLASRAYLLLVDLLGTRYMLVSYFGYSTLNVEATCSSETFVDFQRIHGVVHQKTELDVTTAMTSFNSS
jgi:hypothetical protein